MNHLPEALDQRVRAELRDREQLIWVGHPRPSRFVWSAIPVTLFGIYFTAFAVFWVGCASGILFGGFEGGGQGGFAGLFSCLSLFGFPFVLFGLGLLLNPLFMYRQAKRTWYALTDQRVVVADAKPFGGLELRSFGPEELATMFRREYSSGTGDLIFERLVPVGAEGGRPLWPRWIEHGFFGINGVRDVEELIRKTLLASR